MNEVYEYYLVGNALPFFDSLIPPSLLDRAKQSIELLTKAGVPDDYLELQARFNGGWLTYNPTTGEFE